MTVKVWLTRSRAATGSDTSLGGRRPRSSGHAVATCTPYPVANHTWVRPACFLNAADRRSVFLFAFSQGGAL
ncbi:hypothetical protein ACWGA9_26755 [Streptomyces sp. NPDC054950]